MSICPSLFTNYCGIPCHFLVGFDEIFKMLSSYKVSEKIKGWPERKVEAGDQLLWNLIKSTWALTLKSKSHRKLRLINPIADGTAQIFFPFLVLFVCLFVRLLEQITHSCGALQTSQIQLKHSSGYKHSGIWESSIQTHIQTIPAEIHKKWHRQGKTCLSLLWLLVSFLCGEPGYTLILLFW